MTLSIKQLTLLTCSCVAFGVTFGFFLSLKYKLYISKYSLRLFNQFWPFNSNKVTVKKNGSSSIKVVATNEEIQVVLPNIQEDLLHIKLLGFDCEWTSINATNHPVALLQLATVSGLCILIRLNHFKEKLPASVRNILQDKSILKVGVGSYDDAKKLFCDHGIIVNGCVDLRFLVEKDIKTKVKSTSLKNLAAYYLNASMEKCSSVRRSNWDIDILTNKQVQYAADDALVGLKIFSKLMQVHLEKCNIELDAILQSSLENGFWELAYSHCKNIIDMKYKEKPGSNVSSEKMSRKKANQCKPFKSYSVRKVALYDNCKIEAPDGQLLSTCDKKKAYWYINKELADMVCDEPITVRLRFEPAGRSTSDDEYYLHDKRNICVVCGSEGPIVRKNIVPQEYRKHFPLLMKDHSSHDIVPLCVPCHQRSGYNDLNLRKKLAEIYEAPLCSSQNVQVSEDSDLKSVRSAGRALIFAKHKLPLKRKEELENVLKEYYKVDRLSEGIVQMASNLETKYKDETYVPHGEKVVSSILLKDHIQGVMQFERTWREHFLEKMEPSFMPICWSVTHNHKKLLNFLTTEH